MHDPQSLEPFGEFLGDHRSPAVGHEPSGKTAFLDPLGEPVDEVLGGLGEVPLQMAAQPRMVVEDAQGDGRLPAAAGREDLQPAVVEIAVPQRADVLGFVAADLALFAALGRQDFAGAALDVRPRLAEQAVGLHVAPDRAIRSQRSQRRIGLDRRRQVVEVQLVGPVRMGVVLLGQLPDQRRRQGDLAAVLAHGAAEDLERIVLLPRLVVPAFDGDGGEVDLAAADRVRPGLGGEGLEGGLEFSAQGANSAAGPPPRNGSGPTRPRLKIRIFWSLDLLANRVKTTARRH